MTTVSKVHVFDARFPSFVAATLSLLRKRLHLSREVSDDVVRARGRLMKEDNSRDKWEVRLFDFLRHGPYRIWHANGFRREIAHVYYVGSHLHGLSRDWDENGTLISEISYVNGQPHGIARNWRNDGTLAALYVYEHGELVPTCTTLHETTDVSQQVHGCLD